MKHLTLLCLIILFSHWLVGQTVYEKILIPIIAIQPKNKVDKTITEKADKLIPCKNYLVANAWMYANDDDYTCSKNKNEIHELFKYAIKDSLRWVKITSEQMGKMIFTITLKSSTVKIVPSENNHELYYTVLDLCNNKKEFSEKDTNVYLQLTIKAEKKQTQHLLFETFKQAIYFDKILSNGNPCKFFTNPLMNEAQANEIYKEMAENVQFIGKMMKQQNDSQNQPVSRDCKYKGKMLFDAMEMTTVEDIKMFLSYCAYNSHKYVRNTWSISEVYATWLVAGMPLPTEK